MTATGGDETRVLLTGCRGMLGTEVGEALGGVDLLAVDVEELDITDGSAVRATVGDFRPHVIMNCAAYTDVDGAENDRETAFAVNAAGPANLAVASADAGSLLLHVSTDYVFDGTSESPYLEKSPTCPLNAYGESKLAGEELIQEAGGRWLIARTAWLYGRSGSNFVETVLKLAGEHKRLRMVNDQVGSPTYAGDLADILVRLALRGATGIVNATNSGSCTWFEFAVEILSLASMSDVAVDAVASEEFPRPAARPAFSVLSLERVTELLGETPRGWREALRDYMDGR